VLFLFWLAEAKLNFTKHRFDEMEIGSLSSFFSVKSLSVRAFINMFVADFKQNRKKMKNSGAKTSPFSGNINFSFWALPKRDFTVCP
jgi:hypothetical protein